MSPDKEQQVRFISQRLSLREPQRRSLEILADLDASLAFHKDQDVAAALEAVKKAYPSVHDFERDFPSLCFALATGVGKTRLMGAFIAYMHRTGRSHHFFILAPNLTIYNKLIKDFTPGHEKYVLPGIDVFSTHPPIIVTGENYQDGAGVRREGVLPTVVRADECHINIFNISKIDSEARGGREPRIKRLSEYIGQSYFEYLAALPDLVLIMDEAHRYRANAGMKAINELKPILGLELTATPHTERAGNVVPFKNIVFNYPLAKAIDDGFVKKPAVLTRKDLNAETYSLEEMERLKLEDGIKLHESVKVKLELYARDEEKPLVKPFALVVARDIEHAKKLEALIQAPEFFRGAYQGKVITVHSNMRGDESDDVVEKLLKVEDAANPVEVVIHVNMLKEGWDVRNLYTIIPLRKADARTLIEQTIGRGLRLPFGRPTGIDDLDRLTIVAHDNFQAIVDEARKPGSTIRMEAIELEGGQGPQKPFIVPSPPLALVQMGQTEAPSAKADQELKSAYQTSFIGDNWSQKAAGIVVAEIKVGRARNLAEWKAPEKMAELVKAVERSVLPAQPGLEGLVPEKPDVEATVRKIVENLESNIIQIPKVIVGLKPGSEGTYEDFDLDLSAFQPLQAVSHDILIQQLRDGDQTYLNNMGDGVVRETVPGNYVLRKLVELDQINYDRDKELLNKLAGQVAGHYRKLLGDNEEALHNVLLYQARYLASNVAKQLDAHFVEPEAEFEVTALSGYVIPESADYESDSGEILPLRSTITPLSAVPKKVFGGFKKCMYPCQKFDSNPERLLAIVLENDAQVQHWVRPIKRLLRIHVSDGDYRPDFVVETKDGKWVVEVKAREELKAADVLEKQSAALRWCEAATTHDGQHKPWAYLLVAAEDISEALSFDGVKRLAQR